MNKILIIILISAGIIILLLLLLFIYCCFKIEELEEKEYNYLEEKDIEKK